MSFYWFIILLLSFSLFFPYTVIDERVTIEDRRSKLFTSFDEYLCPFEETRWNMDLFSKLYTDYIFGFNLYARLEGRCAVQGR